MASQTRFVLNGSSVSVDLRPDTTVLDVLRNELSMKGTKEGCAEGDCGACTILLQRKNINGGNAMAANACIMTLGQIDGASVTTVEGLKKEGSLSALQAAMAANGSSQCGFCTPGIVMAATGLLANNPEPVESDIHDALAGNLCRCTGYRPIVEAVQSAAAQAKPDLARSVSRATNRTTSSGATVHRPKSLTSLLQLRAERPEAIVLAGGTDLGVAHAAYENRWPEIVSTEHVRELRTRRKTGTHFSFGASVTWQEIFEAIRDDYPSLATLIRRFGSTQIRSMGTIGGNIGTASPIGDGPPALIALGADITLASAQRGKRTMPIEAFFLDYRQTELKPDEVIVSVQVPRRQNANYMRVWKVSKRYDQDISTVCGAFMLTMDDDTIADARVAYGGMAAIPKRAAHVESALIGRQLTAQTCEVAAKSVSDDFTPLSDWRGSAQYRMEVAAGLILRLAHDYRGERVEVMA